MAKHPSKTVRWKWQVVTNFFYDKWMRWVKKSVPTTFNFRTNRYEYEPRTNVDAAMEAETEPVHELIGYNKDPQHKPW